MSKFEDQLWADLMAGHGDDMAQEHRASGSRRAKPFILTAGTLGLAGAATVVALTLTATTGAVAAYAVTPNPNGTITITINDLVGIKGANEQLAKLGVPIRAVPITADCPAPSRPAPGQGHSQGHGAPVGRPPVGGPDHSSIRSDGKGGVVVNPKDIPRGATMVLAASRTNDKVMLAAQVVHGPAPTCIHTPPANPVHGGTNGPEEGTHVETGTPGAPAPPIH
jgi:hypothetical protein